jgi:hypothetical protein
LGNEELLLQTREHDKYHLQVLEVYHQPMPQLQQVQDTLIYLQEQMYEYSVGNLLVLFVEWMQHQAETG